MDDREEGHKAPPILSVPPIAFGQRLAGSSSFNALFDDGIALIEETAAYLDGEGRAASKTMSNNGKLTYATLSMKLTTRLMSLASWLLVQRAVNEGEMTPETGRSEHDKVKLGDPLSAPESLAEADAMPDGLVDLFGRCADLQHRVLRLNAILRDESVSDTPPAASNAVASQLHKLEDAFG
ncbi:MAG: DUF1465 family protein [Pseudomonadota bacterium]